MRNLVLCVVLGVTTLAIEPQAAVQDHAPTVEQCVADMRLWSSQMTDYWIADTARMKSGTPNKSEVMGLTIRQLSERSSEMLECISVDPSGRDDYKQEASEYNAAYNDRFERFIVRHHLMDQVLKEDKAGIR
jgi:hypothetical protein